MFYFHIIECSRLKWPVVHVNFNDNFNIHPSGNSVLTYVRTCYVGCTFSLVIDS